jgi:hypothetical protein
VPQRDALVLVVRHELRLDIGGQDRKPPRCNARMLSLL